jgi:hypothetical protein
VHISLLHALHGLIHIVNVNHLQGSQVAAKPQHVKAVCAHLTCQPAGHLAVGQVKLHHL